MNKTAKDYYNNFRMGQPHFNFNRPDFIKAFGLDFLNSLRESDNINPNTGYPKYKEFKNHVALAQKLFNEISEMVEDAGKKPLSNGLWNVFYASYVIEVRKALFKDIQERIDHRKRKTVAQWEQLKPLSEKLHSDENKTKKIPSKRRN